MGHTASGHLMLPVAECVLLLSGRRWPVENATLALIRGITTSESTATASALRPSTARGRVSSKVHHYYHYLHHYLHHRHQQQQLPDTGMVFARHMRRPEGNSNTAAQLAAR